VKSLGICRPNASLKGSKIYDPGRICQASGPRPATLVKAEADGLKYLSSLTDRVLTAPEKEARAFFSLLTDRRGGGCGC
jgi:hypothetical protein